jgi:hypothetical protein
VGGGGGGAPPRVLQNIAVFRIAEMGPSRQ